MRILAFLECFVLFFMLLYIWTKAILPQLIVYASLSLFVAIFLVAYSSGREVLQVKLLHQMRSKALDEGKSPEKVDQVELPEDQVSDYWNKAIAAYSFALPFCFTTLALYATYHRHMVKSNVCKFVELAGKSDDQI